MKKWSFADKVIDFNRNLTYSGKLPDGFRVLNPYLDNPETMEVMRQFYQKYYDDSIRRKFIIGINPSRHGAGVTGVPFTDTKRLESVCGIPMRSARTHEVSSVFVYDMIAAFGGPDEFYKQYYINSPFPLAIVRQSKNGQWLNANYYDDPNLFEAVKGFMIDSLKKHIGLGLDTSKVFVLGKKNAVFIQKLNREANLFDRVEVLEHPRYIQQYKLKEKQSYIDKYLVALGDQGPYKSTKSRNPEFCRELELSLPKSTEEQRQAWARTIIEQDIDLKELSKLLLCEHKTVSRFLWMLSGIGLINREKLLVSLPFYLRSVEEINPAYLTAFANYWRIAGVPEEHEGKAIDLCFEWLLSADTNVTIKSRALFVLFELTKKYPELKSELRSCLLDQMDKHSKDFHKRAVKLLADLS